MGGLTQALRTARSGLLVNQQTLDVVANNIANVNSEGYSRKIVSTETRVLNGVASGVQISEITRRVDEGLLKNIRIELAELNKFTVQDLFGKPGENSSLSHLFENFTSALELLAVSPNRSLEQAEVVRRAQDVTFALQNMSETIQELRQQADVDIADTVTEMNKIVASIDQLNEDIITNGSVGRDVTDLKDQRDQRIDRLSELVDIRFDVVVFTSGGRTLVDTIPPKITHSAASSVSASTTKNEGDFTGIFVGTIVARNDITSELRGGQLKGLVDLRDDILANMQSQLDEFAAEMRDVFNQIHNRGVSFPGAQSYAGTRTFVRSAEQTITFNGTDDTTVVLFDASGNQTAQTTIRTLNSDVATITIANLATQLQAFLRANGAATATVAISTTNKLDINLNTPAINLSFRDETATTNGSTLEDAVIAFNANAAGPTDETVNGFSNFFGFNDFFVDNLAENIYESNVLVSTFTVSASTLTFRDSSGTLGSPLTVAAGTSLEDLATLITNSVTDVTATIVTDGSGVRLRISHDNGSSMTVTQAAGNTFLTDINLHLADVRVAGTLNVRADIASTPAKLSTGAVLWDADRGAAGEYFMSIGENSVIDALAEAFSASNQFDTAGGLATAKTTFAEFASKIVSENARLAATNESSIDRQRSLTESLQFKSDSVRGVNLDEELSNLIIFEQGFAAAARVISVIQRMFETLERVI